MNIPTPAEVAEANRVKDEAEDDRLLAEWLLTAIEALREFRGGELGVLMPGIARPGGWPIYGYSTVRHPDRFLAGVRAALHGTDWYADLGKWSCGLSGIRTNTGKINFGSIAGRAERERRAAEREAIEDRERQERFRETEARMFPERSEPKPEPGPGDELPEPLPRRSFWSFLRRLS